MAINDPDIARHEYETDAGLAARKAAYEYATGPDARQMAFEAVEETVPERVLEIGCGAGELGCAVISTDLSTHMAGLTRDRGVPVLVTDALGAPSNTQRAAGSLFPLTRQFAGRAHEGSPGHFRSVTPSICIKLRAGPRNIGQGRAH